MSFVSRVLHSPYSMLMGVMLGLAVGLSNDSIEAWILTKYDAFFPVVTTNVTIVRATPDEILLSISGVKHRECFLSRPPHAEGRTSGGTPVEMSIERVDKKETLSTRPIGPFAAGLWRLWPRGSAASVQVYLTYDCDGRVIVAKYADVKLP
jgi:hypothetical protein